jgi:hypothetical protein
MSPVGFTFTASVLQNSYVQYFPLLDDLGAYAFIYVFIYSFCLRMVKVWQGKVHRGNFES